MHLVLVVEDDAGIRRVLRTLLDAEGYRVAEASTGARALIEAQGHRPDLAIVDLGLPDGDGQDVVRGIRRLSSIPILVLSARAMERDKVAALDAGADDYVTKPFSAGELLARVRAALRRHAQPVDAAPLLHFGTTTVDLATRTATRDQAQLHLTPLEFRVLECLARAGGMIVTQDHLIREVWGPARLGDTRGLRSYVKMLRQKLEPDPRQPRYLLTEAGVGYRLRISSRPTP